MTRSQATPSSSQIINLERMVRELEDKLAAALAACKLKDEALQNVEGMLDELRDYPITHAAIIEALTIQPDDSALKAWLGEPEWFYRKDTNGVNIFYEDIEERPRGCKPIYSPKGLVEK